MPELKGRVLARVSPESAAEVMLLADPHMLAEAAKQLTKPGSEGGAPDVAKVIESGLPGWLDGVSKQVARGLDDPNAKIEDADRGIVKLTTLIRALDDEVLGQSSIPRLAALAKESAPASETDRRIDAQGYLTGSGDHHVIAVFPEITSDEGTQVAPLVKKIRKVRDEAVAEDPSTPAED